VADSVKQSQGKVLLLLLAIAGYCWLLLLLLAIAGYCWLLLLLLLLLLQATVGLVIGRHVREGL
jgi:hypothetical protein